MNRHDHTSLSFRCTTCVAGWIDAQMDELAAGEQTIDGYRRRLSERLNAEESTLLEWERCRIETRKQLSEGPAELREYRRAVGLLRRAAQAAVKMKDAFASKGSP